jgi:hypothetical protein
MAWQTATQEDHLISAVRNVGTIKHIRNCPPPVGI